MKVTTNDLRNSVYGTPCGSVPECESSLSNEMVIDFIDTFFDGELDDVEVYEESNSILIEGGSPKLKKLTITNAEFDYFTSFDKSFKEDFISDVSDFYEIKKSKLKDIENKVDEDLHPSIICLIFSNIVAFYGGSFRCEYMEDGEGTVELESE